MADPPGLSPGLSPASLRRGRRDRAGGRTGPGTRSGAYGVAVRGGGGL
ncbi:hypothetical protein ACFY8V_08095 [Streptomyces californicus]